MEEKKKRGRPCKPDARDIRHTIRLNSTEDDILKKLSKSEKKSFQEIFRKALIDYYCNK